MSPGISVRPPPSMVIVPSGAGIVPGCTVAIVPSLTRTLMPLPMTSDLPVKTLTLVNKVAGGATASPDSGVEEEPLLDLLSELQAARNPGPRASAAVAAVQPQR